MGLVLGYAMLGKNVGWFGHWRQFGLGVEESMEEVFYFKGNRQWRKIVFMRPLGVVLT